MKVEDLVLVCPLESSCSSAYHGHSLCQQCGVCEGRRFSFGVSLKVIV